MSPAKRTYSTDVRTNRQHRPEIAASVHMDCRFADSVHMAYRFAESVHTDCRPFHRYAGRSCTIFRLRTRKTCKIIVSEITHSVPALLQLATTCCPARRVPTPSSPPHTVLHSHSACRTRATPPRFDHSMDPSIIRCPALHRISRLCRFFARNSPKKFPSFGNRTSSSSFSLGIPDSMLFPETRRPPVLLAFTL